MAWPGLRHLRIEGTFLRSRVGRRVFLLFVLSAFVPAALLTMLWLGHTSRVDADNLRRQLAQDGSSYARGIYERLMGAQFILGVQAIGLREGIAAMGANPYVPGQVFSAIYQMQGGEASTLEGLPAAAPLPALTQAAQEHLAAGGDSALLVEAGEQDARVLLAMRVDPLMPERGLLLGELDPAYLWSDLEELTPPTQVCVRAAVATVLYCSSPDARAQLDPRVAAGTPERAGDGGVLHYERGLFLRARFGADDWSVTTLRLEGDGPAAVQRPTRVFLAVVLLTLLLVAFLSVSQIRRTLVPLEQLLEGTRRIERGEFGHPVAVARDDEFGQLAQAFNRMAVRLGRQIGTLRALSEIDHEILSRVDLPQIIGRVQERLNELWPGAVTSVVVFDQQAADFGIVHFHGGDGLVATLPTQLDPHMLKRLARDYDGLWFDVGATEVPDFLALLVQAGARRILVLPIFWRRKVNGLLTVGLPDMREFSEEQIGQARDLGNRIGVALAAHARDEELKHRAYHDAMTGLPNRALLFERLQQEMAHARRQDKKLALLFIDLDRFKHVNDSLGHGGGDQLLRQVADRLSACVREGDTVARLSGDEFVVLLPGLASAQQSSRLANEMLGLISEPFMIDGSENYIGASIGVSIYPDDASLAAELLKKADMAMYRAKSMGRGRVVYFEEGMNLAQQERNRMERALHQALARQEFSLGYQPRYVLPQEKPVGAEALLRWHHPELGWVPPAKFIPLAEEIGLIESIGAWVLEQVGEQLVQWQNAGLDIAFVAVNVSGRQLRSGRLLAQVQSMLKATGLAPGALLLEVVEGTLIDSDEDAVEQLNWLRHAGVQIALDDFGVGYSSMTYLQRLPIGVLKIDRSFIGELGRSASADGIVQSIIALGHAMQKSVVAEGVETTGQLERLRLWGCEQVQGNLFSPPLTAAELEALLAPSRPAEIL